MVHWTVGLEPWIAPDHELLNRHTLSFYNILKNKTNVNPLLGRNLTGTICKRHHWMNVLADSYCKIFHTSRRALAHWPGGCWFNPSGRCIMLLCPWTRHFTCLASGVCVHLCLNVSARCRWVVRLFRMEFACSPPRLNFGLCMSP